MGKFARKIERSNQQRLNKFIMKRLKRKRLNKQIDAYGKFIKKELHPSIFTKIKKWIKNKFKKVVEL